MRFILALEITFNHTQMQSTYMETKKEQTDSTDGNLRHGYSFTKKGKTTPWRRQQNISIRKVSHWNFSKVSQF